MTKKITPLMKQYYQIKEKYPDTILLFRMGDFFETFDNDAVITAKVCNIALTKRNQGQEDMTPLAGFPHHQLDAYLPKIVKAGYRVAVCEQLEDPKLAKGLVKRGVVEVVTPGVALYDKMLESTHNNFICSIYERQDNNFQKMSSVAFADISTGEFIVIDIDSSKITEIITSYSPSEILVSKSQVKSFEQFFERLNYKPAIMKLEDWMYEYEFCYDKLIKQFKTINLKGFGIENDTNIIQSAGCLINYMSENQMNSIEQIRKIRKINSNDFINLDQQTRRNLEITLSISDSNNITLFSVIDRTITPMGSRLLKKWISMPLNNQKSIQYRLDAVEGLFDNINELELIRKKLNEISDIERITSKICNLRANPRDCISLARSLKSVPELKIYLQNTENTVLGNIADSLKDLDVLYNLIFEAIKEDPSINIGSGNVFNIGYNNELDTYIEYNYDSKSLINQYQEEERLKSGISNLKVSFNNVFGYYIEISKANAVKAPQYYERRQTITNAERYTTPELKELESKIFSAEEKISSIENQLFKELLSKISEYTEDIQGVANNIAIIDSLQSFARIAIDNQYTKPILNDGSTIEIINGRHPVVEKLLPVGTVFTPNSTYLSNDDELLHIITGPNMSGKSCYLRQVAIIVLLAQSGSFVPAESAKISLVDRIFTRVGAHDNLTSGESTFLVEMQETASILNNATERSLILLDEVGRGTSTFDGISIAWAIAEYIHNHLTAKTLFATHYHELNDLENRYEKIKNYRVEVIETGEDIIFSHKVNRGASDYSFGIHVAKMAGLPYDLIERANEIMKTLEEDNISTEKNQNKPNIKQIKTKKMRKETDQLAIFEFRDDYLRDRLSKVKIEQITPIQALNLLMELQKESKK